MTVRISHRIFRIRIFIYLRTNPHIAYEKISPPYMVMKGCCLKMQKRRHMQMTDVPRAEATKMQNTPADSILEIDKTTIRAHQQNQAITEPTGKSLSGSTKANLPSGLSAINIIPRDSIPFDVRDSRLIKTATLRPTTSSGL